MALEALLIAALVALLTGFLHLARITYNHRSKIEQLRKQGIVRTFYTIVPERTANTPSADAQGMELADRSVICARQIHRKVSSGRKRSSYDGRPEYGVLGHRCFSLGYPVVRCLFPCFFSTCCWFQWNADQLAAGQKASSTRASGTRYINMLMEVWTY